MYFNSFLLPSSFNKVIIGKYQVKELQMDKGLNAHSNKRSFCQTLRNNTFLLFKKSTSLNSHEVWFEFFMKLHITWSLTPEVFNKTKHILIHKFQVHLIKCCTIPYVSPDCLGILRSYNALKDTAEIQNYKTDILFNYSFDFTVSHFKCNRK